MFWVIKIHRSCCFLVERIQKSAKYTWRGKISSLSPALWAHRHPPQQSGVLPATPALTLSSSLKREKRNPDRLFATMIIRAIRVLSHWNL